jgi:hypothetical protein
MKRGEGSSPSQAKSIQRLLTEGGNVPLNYMEEAKPMIYEPRETIERAEKEINRSIIMGAPP